MTKIATLAAAAVFAALYLAAAGPYWKLTPDSVTYVRAAHSLAEGRGYRIAGDPVSFYPPGTSLAMAAAWFAAPGSYRLLHLQQAAAAIGSAVLAFLLFRERVGSAGAGVAGLMLLSSWLLIRQSTFLLSDVLFLLFSLLAFVLRQRSRSLAAALAAGAASSIRLLGVLIAVAFLLDMLVDAWRLRRPLRKPVVAALLGVLLAVGLWEVRNEVKGYSMVGLAAQNEPWVAESGRAGVPQLAKRLIGNLPEYRFIGDLLTNRRLDGRPPWLQYSCVFLLGGLAAGGFWRLTRSGERSEAIYVAMFLVVIALYHPWIEVRWFMPLMPWLYASLVAGWQSVARRFPGRWANLPAALFLAFYLGTGAAFAARLAREARQSPFAPSPFLNHHNHGFQRLAIRAGENSAPDERIASQIPQMTELLAGRRCVGYPFTRNGARLIERLRAQRVRYALVDLTMVPDRTFLLPALEADPRTRLVHSEPQARLYELTSP